MLKQEVAKHFVSGHQLVSICFLTVMLCKADIFVIVLDNSLTCSIHVEIIIHVHDNCSELKTKATLTTIL